MNRNDDLLNQALKTEQAGCRKDDTQCCGKCSKSSIENQREKLASENGMAIEFVDWFFDNKKDVCGNVWFMMMAAMWEGWSSRDAQVKQLAAERDAVVAENVELNNFIAASCFVYAGEMGYWPAIDHSPEIHETNRLSIAESQFLTDVMTAAGLLSCGKRDKQLAQRIADFCVSKRMSSKPAHLRSKSEVRS